MLTRQPEIAQQVLRKLVVGRLTMVPDVEARRYTFTGQAAYDALLAGAVSVVPMGWTEGCYTIEITAIVAAA